MISHQKTADESLKPCLKPPMENPPSNTRNFCGLTNPRRLYQRNISQKKNSWFTRFVQFLTSAVSYWQRFSFSRENKLPRRRQKSQLQKYGRSKRAHGLYAEASVLLWHGKNWLLRWIHKRPTGIDPPIHWKPHLSVYNWGVLVLCRRKIYAYAPAMMRRGGRIYQFYKALER